MAARRRKLARLALRPDSEIDFSEIAPLSEAFWRNAVRNPFSRPALTPVLKSPKDGEP